MCEWECMWKRKFVFTMPFLCADLTVEKDVYGLTCNVGDNDVISHHVTELPGVSLRNYSSQSGRGYFRDC